MKHYPSLTLLTAAMAVSLSVPFSLLAADDGDQSRAAAQKGESASAAAKESNQEPAQKPEPIAGAFGLKLGERFEPALVAKVLSKKEHAYRDPKNKVEVNGTLYKVEPTAPSDAYNQYLVATTPDGIIYSISGVYADSGNKPKCDVTKRLAAELEQKYGKPRGQGSFGNWYSFRDMTSEAYRGVRLNAPKCRSGRYSIVYSDDVVMTTTAPPAPGPASKPESR